MVHAARGDIAGRHRVNTHPGARPFGRSGFCQADHTSARCAAVAHAGHGAPHVGHDVDNSAAVLGHGLGVALARHQKAAGEIGVDHRLPALGADGFERRHVLAPRVVDQAVNRAVLRHDGRYGAAHRVFLADIADMGAGAATACSAIVGDFIGHFLQLFWLAANQCHACAQGCKLVRHTTANARAAPGDDDDIASKQAWREYGCVTHGNLRSGTKLGTWYWRRAAGAGLGSSPSPIRHWSRFAVTPLSMRFMPTPSRHRHR